MTAPTPGRGKQADESEVTPPTTQPQPEQRPVQISCTRGFTNWLLSNNVSIAFTSYQTGRLYLVGVDDKGLLSFHERFLARAMGLWGDPQRLLVSTIFQLWRFENVLAAGQMQNGCDRHYVPRVAHTTGDIDIHEIGVMSDGGLFRQHPLFMPSAVEPNALLSAGLDTAVHHQARRRGSLPSQRPRHEERRASACHGSVQERHRQRVACKASGRRLHH